MDKRTSSWRKHAADTFTLMFNTLCPRPCWLCSAPASGLFCESCENDLPFNNHCRCNTCDLPLAVDAPLCSECATSPPSFQHATCAFRYGFPIDNLMLALKKHGKHRVAPALAHYLLAHLRHNKLPMPEALCPVPIHWKRQIQRGYNQSELIAEHLSNQLKIPIVRALKKDSPTDAQKALSRKKRLRNVADSISVSQSVEGKHIALVDDVITTCASAESCSRLLLNAGATRVDVWAIARTPK